MDISNLILELTERFKLELANVACSVELDLEPHLFINADVMRIEQVFVNLLSNAMRYGAGKPISISTRRLGQDLLEIKMTDHGRGIADQDKARIFERFERAVPSANYGGLGLGLYIARQLVQQHGGTIEVQSTLGLGATFTVILPQNLELVQQNPQEIRV